MLREWLTFRRFITPVVIQWVFWLGVVTLLIVGLVSKSGWQFVLIFFGGSFVWRLICELDILFFRIYDELKLQRGSRR